MKYVHEIIGHQLLVSAHVRIKVVNAIANPPRAAVQTVFFIFRCANVVVCVTSSGSSMG